MPRIILSLALITVVLGALGYGATNAFFSDTETSVANVFTAGAIDLKVDNESYYNGVFNPGTSWGPSDLNDGNGPSSDDSYKFFDFDDLKPDDFGEDTISLHVDTNDAFICADVTLTSNDDNTQTEPEALVDTDGLTEGELAPLVEFVWWADDGDNVFETGENIISQGPIGNLPLQSPYSLALADSDDNVWTGIGGAVAGDTTYYLGKAWCFGEIGTLPITTDNGDNGRSPAGDNNGDLDFGTPEDGGITCNGTALGNESQTDSLTADISFDVVQARHNDGFQCTETVIACSPEEAFADNVVDFNQGVRKNNTAVLPERSDPNDALGMPQSTGAYSDADAGLPPIFGNFFSLGFDDADDVETAEGGWITVEFTDNIIVDGIGDDLKVWEVTGGVYPDELIKLEASQNGVDWFLIESGLTRDATADLADSGLSWAKYIRLTDVSNPATFPDALADGYDLDAFSALNCSAIE